MGATESKEGGAAKLEPTTADPAPPCALLIFGARGDLTKRDRGEVQGYEAGSCGPEAADAPLARGGRSLQDDPP